MGIPARSPRREGVRVERESQENPKPVGEEGLQVPIRRRRRRRGASTGEAPVGAQYRNHVWAIDFQADHLEEGTGFKVASSIDEQTRVILDDSVDVSTTGEDLVGILERLSITHGFPVFFAWITGLNSAAEP